MPSLLFIQPTLANTAQLSAYKKSFGLLPAGIAGTADLYFATSIEEWLHQLKRDESYATVMPNRAPALQFIAIDPTSKEIVGMLNFRKSLTTYLENFGGHIGYSIAPNKRRLGYGTEMLRQALLLSKLPEFNLTRVLITCNESNLGSAKVIENNGGALEDLRFDATDGELVRRYWITIN